MYRYLLSVYGPAESGDDHATDEKQHAFADIGDFNEMLREEGRLVFADGLEQASAATTVDGRGATPVFTDGPYLETTECLGGFWVVEAADLDEALRLAAEASRECRGKVEVRPFRTEGSVKAPLQS